MPIHLHAAEDEVAKIVLLVGNPQRCEYIAENFLRDPQQYTEFRYMYGYTGKYQNCEISVQTVGMGCPSMMIVVEELQQLNVKTLIRIGTSGSLRPEINVSDIVIAHSSHHTNNLFVQTFSRGVLSAVADFTLVNELNKTSHELNIKPRIGTILTTDFFYEPDHKIYEKFSQFGAVAVEMESYSLFTTAARYRIKTASLLTISDKLFHLENNELVFLPKRGDKSQIKKGVDLTTKIALNTIVKNYEYLCG